jgi:hypothetical protein
MKHILSSLSLLMVLSSCASKPERKYHPKEFAFPVFSPQTKVEKTLKEKLGEPLEKGEFKNQEYVKYDLDGDIVKFIFIDGKYRTYEAMRSSK